MVIPVLYRVNVLLHFLHIVFNKASFIFEKIKKNYQMEGTKDSS